MEELTRWDASECVNGACYFLVLSLNGEPAWLHLPIKPRGMEGQNEY